MRTAVQPVDEGFAGQQGQASVEFRKSPTGPFIKHTPESHRDAAALQTSLTKIREAVDKCGEFSVGDAGEGAKVKIAAASLPKLGDDTAAFQLDVLGQGWPRARSRGRELAGRALSVEVRPG